MKTIRSAVYKHTIGAQWIPHRAIHHYNPERKSKLVFPFFFWNRRGVPVHVTSLENLKLSFLGALPPHILSPLQPLWDTQSFSAALQKQASITSIPAQTTALIPGLYHRVTLRFTESVDPASWGTSLYSSAWVGTAMLPHGLSAWDSLLRKNQENRRRAELSFWHQTVLRSFDFELYQTHSNSCMHVM